MSLISTQEIYENTRLIKLGFVGKFLSYGLKHLMALDEVNALYDKAKHLESPAFEKKLLEEMEVTYEILEDDIKRIPKEGPFILLSNHPLGALDGIIMLKAISEVRPDFKIIANFLLHKIEPLQPRVFPVNPFEARKDVKNSMRGMLEAFKHVKNGHCLGVFPAGEVAQKNNQNQIVDREWQLPVIKLVQKAGVPIIPMYFHAKNSAAFYRLSQLHPDVQTAMLPREMIRPRKKPIRVRIGKPIFVKQQSEFETPEELRDFLYKKTSMLAVAYEQNKSIQDQIKIPKIAKKRKKIIPETPSESIVKEIEKLRNKDELLFTYNNYEVFFSEAEKIPNVLREIGRLREITFRAVGEGTNKETDLDSYDVYYHHLFLWDKDENKIAGAYRMGMGKDIYDKYGIEGFYVSELFDFEPEIQPFFSRCIEMGRAFVVKDYQQKPMPLFLLWRGITHVALRNPDHKYIIGGVSISNQFSDFSKSLMIEFMKSHYYDPYVAQYTRPKKGYKVKLKDADKEFLFDAAQADLNKFDKLIEELEPSSLRLPVLIKKYIKQNARVIGFNVDPKFNDAIDGLMYIRVSDIPESTIKPVLEELQKQLEEERRK